MDLNVKDPEAYRLASAIAKQTGESLSKVVVDSLRERHAMLERRTKRSSTPELLAMARKVSLLVRRPYIDHGELLYNEHGLPK